MHKITSSEEFHKELKDNSKVVAYFTATWCGPCQAIKPHLLSLSDEHSSIRFLMIDVDDHQELTTELGVEAMPTFMFYNNGVRSQMFCGADKNRLMATVVDMDQ